MPYLHQVRRRKNNMKNDYETVRLKYLTIASMTGIIVKRRDIYKSPNAPYQPYTACYLLHVHPTISQNNDPT
jgi:hypothetical protein